MDENPLAIAWSDPAWFEAGGTLDHPLDVMAYFSASRFYDRQSNNEIVAMQTRNAMRIDLDKINLANMIGMEFDVDLSNSLPPQLWIIRKQYRESPTKVTLQKMYYILNSTVYQAPDLDTLLESRLLTSLYQISNVFDRTLDRAVFDPVDSRFRWKDDALRDAASLEQSALSGSEAHGMADMRRGLDRIIGRKLAS